METCGHPQSSTTETFFCFRIMDLLRFSSSKLYSTADARSDIALCRSEKKRRTAKDPSALVTPISSTGLTQFIHSVYRVRVREKTLAAHSQIPTYHNLFTMPYEFINNAQIDPKTRKRIRSLVALGNNIGRSVVRPSRKAKAFPQQSVYVGRNTPSTWEQDYSSQNISSLSMNSTLAIQQPPVSDGLVFALQLMT